MRGRLWRNNIPKETGFWEKYLDTCGGPLWSTGYNRRMIRIGVRSGRGTVPDRRNRFGSGRGSRPITMLGYVWNGNRVRITAVDPLAGEYDSMLAKRGIVPVVRTQEGWAEDGLVFAPDSFDVTHARNCLDHSIDAKRAIEQMYAVTKPCVYTFATTKMKRCIEVSRAPSMEFRDRPEGTYAFVDARQAHCESQYVV